MIHGAHVIVYSTNAEADRAFFRDVLGYRYADAGHGWLIFALPPAEVAVHPAEKNGAHELYLMCDDVEAFVAAMKKKGVDCSPVQTMGWGSLTHLTLPGGGKLGVYQPRHASPLDAKPAKTKKAAPAKKKAAPTKKKKAAPAKKKAKKK